VTTLALSVLAAILFAIGVATATASSAMTVKELVEMAA
jgi:hypothetical protein